MTVCTQSFQCLDCHIDLGLKGTKHPGRKQPELHVQEFWVVLSGIFSKVFLKALDNRKHLHWRGCVQTFLRGMACIDGWQVRDHPWVTGKENLIRKVSKEVRDNKKKRVLAPQPRTFSNASGSHHVLIVEDVFLVRELLRKMFGYDWVFPPSSACVCMRQIASSMELLFFLLELQLFIF